LQIVFVWWCKMLQYLKILSMASLKYSPIYLVDLCKLHQLG
jgi:hypothetical protein